MWDLSSLSRDQTLVPCIARQILKLLDHQGSPGDHVFILFPFIFISWRLITLQYCSGFRHILT